MPIPDISVVISCYNACGGKQHALELVTEGLRRQSGVSFEVIFVDGGSEDGTRDYIAELEANLCGCRSVLPDQPLSRAQARNLGARVADGEWLGFVDDDCLLLDDQTLATLVASLERNGFAAGAKRKWFHLGWDRTELKKLLKAKRFDQIDDMTFLPRGINRKTGRRDLYEFSFISFFGGVDPSLFHEVGGYDEGFDGWGHEDLELMMRLYVSSQTYTHLFDDVATYHLNHPIDDSDFTQDDPNFERYFDKEAELDIHFHVNRLFGVYEVEEGPVLEPRKAD